MKIKLIWLGVLAFTSNLAIATTAPATRSVTVDGIAAVVNNTVISRSEVQKRAQEIKAELIQNHERVPAESEITHHVLNNLIDETLQLQTAKRMDLTVSKDDVAHAIEHIAKQNHQTVAELKANLSKYGLTVEKFQQHLERQLLLQKVQMQIIGPKVKVNEADVKRVAAELANRHDNQNNEFHLQDLLVHVHDNANATEITEAQQLADELYSNLQGGTSFEEAVNDQDADNDDLKAQDLGWLALDRLPDVFAKQVSQLQVGQIARPIRTGNGFHLIKLIGIKEHSARSTLSAKDRLQEAHRLVFERAFTEKLQPWLADLRSAAYIQMGGNTINTTNDHSSKDH